MGTQPKVPAGRVRGATCYPAHLCPVNTLSSAFTEKALMYADTPLNCLSNAALKAFSQHEVLSDVLL